MKRIISLLLLLALAAMMVVPVFADDNKNQCAQVLSITDGAEEIKVLYNQHLKEPELMELAAASEDIIPEDAVINHLTMIRQRDVVCDTAPIELSLRSWGPERYLLVFFKAVGEEDWTLLACEFGNFIDVTLPGNGQYAMAWSWG